MFRTSQEFTFSISRTDYVYNFTGQLVFRATELNSIGTLHTEEELSSFGTLLNESLSVPEYWTLELLAQYLFKCARPVFKNLHAVNLYITEHPQRVTEYCDDLYSDIDGEILELESIV